MGVPAVEMQTRAHFSYQKLNYSRVRKAFSYAHQIYELILVSLEKRSPNIEFKNTHTWIQASARHGGRVGGYKDKLDVVQIIDSPVRGTVPKYSYYMAERVCLQISIESPRKAARVQGSGNTSGKQRHLTWGFWNQRLLMSGEWMEGLPVWGGGGTITRNREAWKLRMFTDSKQSSSSGNSFYNCTYV